MSPSDHGTRAAPPKTTRSSLLEAPAAVTPVDLAPPGVALSDHDTGWPTDAEIRGRVGRLELGTQHEGKTNHDS